MTDRPATAGNNRRRRRRRGFLTATAGLAALAGANLAPSAARALDATAAARPTTTEPFWGAHQGGIVTPAQALHLYRRLRSHRPPSAPTSRSCCAQWTDGRRAPERRASRSKFPARATTIAAQADPADVARPVALALTRDFRLRPRPVRQGRPRPLRPARPAAGGLRRSAAISPATNWFRRAPAAICRCRPAPTIRRSPFTPFASWRASPTASREIRWVQAGFVSDYGAKAHAAQSDGLQGRHRQSLDRATRKRNGRGGVGRRRGASMDARRQPTSSSAAPASRSSIGTA